MREGSESNQGSQYELVRAQYFDQDQRLANDAALDGDDSSITVKGAPEMKDSRTSWKPLTFERPGLGRLLLLLLLLEMITLVNTSTVPEKPLSKDRRLSFEQRDAEVPTLQPTSVPSNETFSNASSMPTLRPTSTVAPSRPPTDIPSAAPTRTPTPTSFPSSYPSNMPSQAPSEGPTFSFPDVAIFFFRQELQVGNGRLFFEEELDTFESLYQNYTEELSDDRVHATCTVLAQELVDPQRRNLGGSPFTVSYRRAVEESTNILLEFLMEFSSVFSNVSTFADNFETYVNMNLTQVASRMQLAGLNVTAAFVAAVPDPTAAPTVTPSPTTSQPTTSIAPSASPTMMPSPAPSTSMPSAQPTTMPSDSPSEQPTARPKPEEADTTVILISVGVALAILFIGIMVVYQRKRLLLQELEFQAVANRRKPLSRANSNVRAEVYTPKSKDRHEWPDDHDHPSPLDTVAQSSSMEEGLGGARVLATLDSIVSNKSLLSPGNTFIEDSSDEEEASTTRNLADEFDQYTNMVSAAGASEERMTPGFQDMVAEALTMALGDDDDTPPLSVERPPRNEEGQLADVEIEASALADVVDWLKRVHSPSTEERRLFMQELLQRMITVVQEGILGPEVASRSIHECAALLGIQLAGEVPNTTLMVSGMRKTGTVENMVEVLSKFGEISESALATNQRGFGIIRFQNSASVDRVMHAFRHEEIEIQDVAVQVRNVRMCSFPSDNVTHGSELGKTIGLADF